MLVYKLALIIVLGFILVWVFSNTVAGPLADWLDAHGDTIVRKGRRILWGKVK